MNRQLLHTPEGVRDICDEECEKKLALEDTLHQIMVRYGYRPIQTPTFEFFDMFGHEIGTTPAQNLYKFFDREGNTLVLRPRSRAARQNITAQSTSRFGFAIWAIFSSITAAIRGG